jgi:LPXTG-motif cell wall-anchored protein
MNRITRIAALAAAPLVGALLLPLHVDAAPSLGSAQISNACDGANGGFQWHVDYGNTTAQSLLVGVLLNGVTWSSQHVPAGASLDQTIAVAEGQGSTLEVTVDGFVLATELVETVDCKPNGAPMATIEIVCPTAEKPDEDIFVRYTMTRLGLAAQFTYSDLSGAEDGKMLINDATEVLTFKVAEGDIVDAWIMVGQTTLATMIDTVHCEPIVVIEDEPTPAETPETGDSAGSSGTAGGSPTLPQTGSRGTLAAAAAALCGIGAVLATLARRRPAAV